MNLKLTIIKEPNSINSPSSFHLFMKLLAQICLTDITLHLQHTFNFVNIPSKHHVKYYRTRNKFARR